MARWGMVIDLDRCTACQACVVACQAENNIPPSQQSQAEMGRSISWMQLVTDVE
jgi:molybdopterin-containing oxidoreductase family iron-sulfur binding subunit